MWTALILLASAPAHSAATNVPTPPCVEKRRPLLEMSVSQFDQDPDGGWRKIAERATCRGEAADLIADYREHLLSRLTTLYWHEGQLRASVGDTEMAVSLMKKARHPAFVDGIGQDDWNAYVDATIAFLQNDRQALIRARKRLVAFPRVNKSAPPANLNVVDGLLRCFGRTYQDAYGSVECQAPNAAR